LFGIQIDILAQCNYFRSKHQNIFSVCHPEVFWHI
jgi:hypothetical protein